jgi:lipoate-protein ligase A
MAGEAAAGWWLIEPWPAVDDQMAIDLAMLHGAIERQQPEALLRLYRWPRPTLSVGANLPLPAEAAGRCAAGGVDVVRRPTGGGCVLHDGDLTYAVVAPERGRGVLATYRWVASGLIAGLRLLGIEAAVVEHPAAGRPLDCFQEATGADLSVAGRKLCGSAQLRRSGWFLQHGSIPIADVRARAAALLGGRVEDSSTCLERVKPGTTWQDLATVVIRGFTSAWGGPPSRRVRNPADLVPARREEAGMSS